MPNPKDLRGQVFGRLVVIAEAANTKTGSAKWLPMNLCKSGQPLNNTPVERRDINADEGCPDLHRFSLGLCQCVCGNQTTVRAYDLGRVTQSCGCLRRETIGKQFSKHGQSGSKVYAAWSNIIDRCTNPNNKDFHHYGGRGIQVCERWYNSFELFLLDMGQPPSSKHSVDRIQVNGNYEPSNCRWATQKEQTRNMRKSHMLTWGGKTQCISAWAEELNVSKSLFHDRLRLGWSTENIFQRILEDRSKSSDKPSNSNQKNLSTTQDLDDWQQTINGVTDNAEEKQTLIDQVGELTSQIGWTTERSQGYLKQNYGVSGRKQLSVKQLSQLIESLTQIKNTSTNTKGSNN